MLRTVIHCGWPSVICRSRKASWRIWSLLVLALGIEACAAATYIGTPSSYRPLVTKLKAGDRLLLAPGVYRDGLSVHHLHGTARKPIAIVAMNPADRPVFWARRGRNVVSIRDASHVTIANLILNGRGQNVAGVKQEGGAPCMPSRNIEIRGLLLFGFLKYQQQVGISTKCLALNWWVRRNAIIGGGTGLYFGNSNGLNPFIGGIVEHNLVVDTVGYNLQVKHQVEQPDHPWLRGSGPQATIIRHNVFSKLYGSNLAAAYARPNVLLGAQPASGRGADDAFRVYGNYIFQNPSEALLQAEGNVAVYGNVLVNQFTTSFPALAIQPHHGEPRRIRVLHNTIITRGVGISVQGRPPLLSIVGNAIFADSPFNTGYHGRNFWAPVNNASAYLRRPFAGPGEYDFRPRGVWRRPAKHLEESLIGDLIDVTTDFDGLPSVLDGFGAYAPGNTGHSWSPERDFKRLEFAGMLPADSMIGLRYRMPTDWGERFR